MYDKQRRDKRLTLITQCLLNIGDSSYNCLVDNISTIGASVEIDASDQNYIHVGDIGTLNVLLLSPVKYLCKVVRINSNQIGLQFVDN